MSTRGKLLPRWRRMAFLIIGTLCMFYLIACLGLFLLQRKIIFPAPPANTQVLADYEDQQLIIDHNGISLHGWFIDRGPDTPVMIYYQGNGEDAGNCIERLQEDAPEYSLLVMNFRSYGLSEGIPGEQEVVADALHVFDIVCERYQRKPEEVVLYGRSLGTGVAVQVAEQRPVAGLVLITPYDAITHVAAHHYPFFFVHLLIRHHFDSFSRAPKMRQPVFFITAGQDAVIPNSCSEKLIDAWGGPVTHMHIEEATHGDVVLQEECSIALTMFLNKL